MANKVSMSFGGSKTQTSSRTPSSGSGGGGSNITVDQALDESSTNPVQNQAIYEALDEKMNADGSNADSTEVEFSTRMLRVTGDILAYGSIIVGDENNGGGHNNLVVGDDNETHDLDHVTMIGDGLEAVRSNSLVVGKFNRALDNALFEIGNGTSEDGKDKSSAFAVTADGKVWTQSGYILDYVNDNQISKVVCTPNIDRFTGLQNGYYPDDFQMNETVYIPNASSIEVTIKYQLEAGCDYIELYDKDGNKLTVDAEGNQVGDDDHQISSNILNTVTYIFNTSTIKIHFESDSSVHDYYGFYATIKYYEESNKDGTVPIKLAYSDKGYYGFKEENGTFHPLIEAQDIHMLYNYMDHINWYVTREMYDNEYIDNTFMYSNGNNAESTVEFYNSDLIVGRATLSRNGYRLSETTNDATVAFASTNNVGYNGYKNTNYGNNESYTKSVTIPNATKIKVTIYYATQGVNYDYVCIRDHGSATNRTTDDTGKSIGSTASSTLGRIGGAGSTSYTSVLTINQCASATYTFNASSIDFYWRSSASGVGYGFYAKVEGLEYDAIRFGKNSNGEWGYYKGSNTTLIPFGSSDGMRIDGSNASTHVIFPNSLTLGIRAAGSTVGETSFAGGVQPTASGKASFAYGYMDSSDDGYKSYPIASNFGSIALNGGNASGIGSVAINDDTEASGEGAFASGWRTKASGDFSHAEGSYTSANKDYSHAEGDHTHTNGSRSHAEGYYTEARGWGSHAEGHITLAGGDYSHTEGDDTEASGDFSHAEGKHTRASGPRSHAEGDTTGSNGKYAHSEGYYTIADGDYSHTEGGTTSTNAYGVYAHAEGKCTKANNRMSHSEGYATIASGSRAHAEGNFTYAAGSSSHSEGAFTIANGEASKSIGYGGGRNTYIQAVAPGSVAGGYLLSDIYTTSGTYPSTGPWLIQTKTPATGSMAHGYIGHAYNDHKAVKGASTVSAPTIYTQGKGSVALGAIIDNSTSASTTGVLSPYSIHTSGAGSLAFGCGFHNSDPITATDEDDAVYGTNNSTDKPLEIRAVGKGSFAHGYLYSDDMVASGNGSHAEGCSTQATGHASHAEGTLTIASGYSSHAAGFRTKASGDFSHAEGYAWYPNYVTASGTGSHAEGLITTASGIASHAEGNGTLASGHRSHAEGSNTIASGDGSHTEGYNTRASASYAKASGSNVTANLICQMVHGYGYNKFPSSISQHGNSVFGLQTYCQTYSSNSTITTSENGFNAQLSSTATLTLSLKLQGIYMLFTSTYTASNGTIYGRGIYNIVAHGYSSGTPGYSALATAGTPATISMLSSNRISIANQGSSYVTQFSLIRIC